MAVPPRTQRWIVVAAIVLLGAYVVRRALIDAHDFDGFHRAARQLLETGELSDDKNVARYPPTFQVLHLPFASLPLVVAAVVWYLLNVAALLGLPRMLERLGGVAIGEQRAAWLVMAPFVLDNLVLGQSAPVLLWLATAGLVLVRNGVGLAGGALLGLGAAFKVLPGLLLVVPLVMGRGRSTLAGAVLAVGLCAAALVAATSGEQALAATTRWIETVRLEQTPWSLVANNRSLRYNNQGLGVTLARSLADIHPAEAKGRVVLASWPLTTAWTLLGVLWTLAAVFGVLAARGARRRGLGAGPGAAGVRELHGADAPETRGAIDTRGEPDTWLSLLSLAALGGLLLSPIVWTHYFLWMLPGLLVIRAHRRVVAVGGLLLVAALAVPALRALGVHMLASLALYLFIAAKLAFMARAPARDAPAMAAAHAERGSA